MASPDTILVSGWHVHSQRRDSLAEIALILLLYRWLVALLTKRIILGAKGKKQRAIFTKVKFAAIDQNKSSQKDHL